MLKLQNNRMVKTKVKMLNTKHDKHAKSIWVTCFCLIIASIVPIFAIAQDSWPQWRGLTRDGKIQDSQWPTSPDARHLTTLWCVRLGPSYSSPILGVNRVFVTETQN